MAIRRFALSSAALRRILLLGITTATAAILLTAVQAAPPNLTVEDIVQRNVASIGAPQTRAAMKSLLVGGTATFAFLSGGEGGSSGPFAFLTRGDKLLLQFKFNTSANRAEEFCFNGEKNLISSIAPGKRSQLGQFLQDNGAILSEGLLGGTLSTAWPLLDTSARHPKLSIKGMKKVDGRDLYKMDYRPQHGGGDLQISLYFEPETFRHVLTTYELVISPTEAPTLIGGPDQSMRMPNTRYKLEEAFSDFKAQDGLTFPRQWSLTLYYWGRVNSYSERFDMAVEHVDTNLAVDKTAFTIN